MKKLLIGLMFVVIPSSIYAIGGIGFQFGQGSVTVGATEDGKDLGLGITANMTTTEFSDPYSVGVHVYIDAIPFIDLEADINVMGQDYEFGFNNPAEIGPYKFVWGSASTYFTVRKKILGLGIPFLAKANLFYGGGYNQHMVTPLMTIDLMEEMMGGDLGADPTNIIEKELIDFLDDNKLKTNGFHIQTGLQFKVLVLDIFLFYRHTFAKDLIPDANNFGSINLRIGVGL
jgi:hypothetical protein